MKVTEKRIRPRFAGEERDRRGRRPLAADTLSAIDQAAAEAAAEIAPRIEQMIRDRLEHVGSNIPETWKEGDRSVRGEQELVLVHKPNPPFFGVTTRPVKD